MASQFTFLLFSWLVDFVLATIQLITTFSLQLKPVKFADRYNSKQITIGLIIKFMFCGTIVFLTKKRKLAQQLKICKSE